ncbi:phosphate ABC transporter permease subunit PstC [Nitrosomonas sp. HPC101]|uniref:phosphate ABC transporter permease subunit PstC n=1 Tax=Nitrosomonas sp. HPC101 TaxID=1658667 RepID=UPI001370AABD|nr:phosphate ABC transporter permease subunit PstC [Nitrosomonas sp. HPC101]MXS85554.1 phosphate ABC transporter permease subunit PstC [Nitrosomonas sp. HPC101]
MKKPFLHNVETDSICQPPSPSVIFVDRAFRMLARLGVILVFSLIVVLVLEIGIKALPSIQKSGLDVITGTVWDVGQQKFGILPAIWGTLYSSLIALFVGGFFGISMAIFLTQDFLHPRLAAIFRAIVELLAAIPSVVYGLWGIFVVIPAIRPLTDELNESLGWIPFFSSTLSGPGLLPAALVLAIMILPTIAAVSQDALRAVPLRTKQAAYGMGTTHWEAILKVMVPTAATGIFGSLVLGLGRALGETMALAMLIGNSNQISLSLFAPANTLAAMLALNFPEAGPSEIEVLMYAALVLMLITLVVNVLGSMIITYAQRGMK